MGSVGNPISSTYTTYDNYRDCSLGICSIYCPQFCYLIFPPPPPSDDGTLFPPLIIAIIGVLASAFILVSYYTIVTRYCKRRSVVHSSINQENDENDHQTSHGQFQTGLDEGQIKTITVLKYQKGEGLVDGSECAVCLGEFQENESLRLLPKCDHAFHLPCIDTWLKSQSNCPLCRANAVPSPLPPISTAREMNCCEVRRPNDLILVVDNQEMNSGQEMVVFDGEESGNGQNGQNGQEGVGKFGRSVSLGSFSSERRLLVSDILKIEDVDEDLQVKGVGSSKGRDVAMKRSISSDRFMFTGHGKGKSSVLPR